MTAPVLWMGWHHREQSAASIGGYRTTDGQDPDDRASEGVLLSIPAGSARASFLGWSASRVTMPRSTCRAPVHGAVRSGRAARSSRERDLRGTVLPELPAPVR